jgi:hypothetical protein
MQHVRGQNVSIFKLFNVPFLGRWVESMRINLSYSPIFFFDAARVLILFWGDFGQRGGGRYVTGFQVGVLVSIVQYSVS